MRYILGTLRLLLVILATMYYTLRVVIGSWGKRTVLESGYEYAPKWGAAMAKLIGMKIEVVGNVPQGKALILPNHRSYADIFLVYNFVACAFIAKAELRKWPLMGYAAQAGGTIFVNRSDPNSRKATILAMKERLKQGFTVTVFPEGTTHFGPLTKDFKMGTFRIAAEGNIPILPTAIEYEKPEDAWVGKEWFLPHFYRVYGRPVSKVKIRFGELLEGTDAQVLAQTTKTWIDENLKEMRSEFEQGK